MEIVQNEGGVEMGLDSRRHRDACSVGAPASQGRPLDDRAPHASDCLLCVFISQFPHKK